MWVIFRTSRWTLFGRAIILHYPQENIMTETDVPVALLNREQLSLQRNAVVAQKCLRVGLERYAKLHRLASNYHDWYPAVGVARNRKKRRRTLPYPFKQVCSEKATLLGEKKVRTKAIASNHDYNNNGQAAVLSKWSKLPLADIYKQDGSGQTAVLETETKTPSTNISGQDCEDEAAILGTESVQPLPINTLGTLYPISGQTSNAPDNDGSELTTSSRSPSGVIHTCQDKSISKEDFMALLCLSPTSVVARVRRCNYHKISKDLHIKSRKIWRKISGEGNICYSALMAKAVLRSFKVEVSLKRSDFVDRLARQAVPRSIHIKNLESLRKRSLKAANNRKRLVDFCCQKPSSVNVVLKRDSDLDQLALQMYNVRSTSVSSDPPGKSAVDPITTPLSTGNTTSITTAKPGCKWLSVDIKRDFCLDMLAQQTSDSMCVSLPSSYPGMSSITPGKVGNTMKVPLSTGTSTSPAPERHGSKWLSVHIIRDSSFDVLAQQTSHCTSNSSGTCIISPSEPKHTSAVTLSTNSTIRDSGSDIDVLAHKTTDFPFEFLSSKSPGISIISSDANRTSAVPSSITPIHAIENLDLKNLRIKIIKDSCIDQLALQTFKGSVTDSGSNCSDSSVSNHPTPKLPLASGVSLLKNLPREGAKSLTNCRGKLKLLPSIEISNISITPALKTGVIRLRRLISDDWSIVQPDEPGCPSSSSKIGATESTDSIDATVEPTRKSHVSRLAQLPASRSVGSDSGFSRKSRSHGIKRNLSSVPTEQTKACPIFRYSTKRSFKDPPKPIPLGSCSSSPKRRTRSVLRMEESLVEWHYNENENPRQHDIPIVKTVNMLEKHFPAGVEYYRVRTKSCHEILANDSLEEPRTEGKAARVKAHSNNCKLVKPSISSYMSVKKPLAVKSPNHEPTC